eukprot:Nk52_evm21s1444 gene=Nk52_evmTU21s1444
MASFWSSLNETVAEGWAPFPLAFVVLLLFSIMYVRHYQHKRESEFGTTVAAIMALTCTLSSVILLPTDIFLVSSTKDHDTGTRYEWATQDSIDHMMNAVSWAYCVCYIVIVVFAFVLIPFFYFYYEEYDLNTTKGQRVRAALKYSSISIILVVILLFVGIIVKPNEPPGEDKFKWLLHIITEGRGTTALNFAVGCLSVFGAFCSAIYVGVGLASLPIGMIKGARLNEVSDPHTGLAISREQIRAIRARYMDGRIMSDRDSQELARLEQRESFFTRHVKEEEKVTGRFRHKLAVYARPIQVAVGIVMLVTSILMTVSLFIGLQNRQSTLNPLDIVFVWIHEHLFPVDYMFFTLLVMYVVMAALSGIKKIGIRFLWVNMYKIRAHRTPPQGLLILCSLLVFITLSFSAMLLSIVPQYATYGSQTYVHGGEVVACNRDAEPEDCTMTSLASFAFLVMYEMSFFAVAYKYLNYAFVVVFCLSLFVVSLMKAESIIEKSDGQDDEEEEEDVDLLRNA